MNYTISKMKLTISQMTFLSGLTFFGLLTLFMSGSVIFDLFGIRNMEGNYVPFIVWINFICGFLYVLSGWGFVKHKKWTTYLLVFIAIVLSISLIGLRVYINQGYIYEAKTVNAMLFRMAVTLVFGSLSWHFINKRNNNKNE